MLGQLIRKVLMDLIADFEELGAHGEFIFQLRADVDQASDDGLLDHLRSPEFAKNHFLFGKLPLVFLIEADKGTEYVDALSIAEPALKEWFTNRITLQKPSSLEQQQQAAAASNLSSIDDVFSAIDPAFEHGGIVELTKEIAKDMFKTSGPEKQAPVSFPRMMKAIESKLKAKVEAGEVDVAQLETQSKHLLKKMEDNPTMSALISMLPAGFTPTPVD